MALTKRYSGLTLMPLALVSMLKIQLGAVGCNGGNVTGARFRGVAAYVANARLGPALYGRDAADYFRSVIERPAG
jgi:hypothetical protein